MKLKKSIYETSNIFDNRFKEHPRTLRRGDYIRLLYLLMNQRRRKSEGRNFRIHDRVFLLFQKRHRKNSLHFVVTSLYKHERVRFRFLITSPYIIRVCYVRKAQRDFNKLFNARHQFK